MEYVYAAMLLHKAGQEVTEDNVESVLDSAGVDVEESRVKALVAALEGVDIDEAIEQQAAAAPAAAPSGGAGGGEQSGGQESSEEAGEEAAEESGDEQSDEDEVSEEEAAEGLGNLF